MKQCHLIVREGGQPVVLVGDGLAKQRHHVTRVSRGITKLNQASGVVIVAKAGGFPLAKVIIKRGRGARFGVSRLRRYSRPSFGFFGVLRIRLHGGFRVVQQVGGVKGVVVNIA
jgi:hypothetical protein